MKPAPGLNIAALGSSENSAAVDALHATLTAIRDGLKSVAGISQTGAKPFLRFDRLSERIDGMITMIEAARSDLAAPPEGQTLRRPGRAAFPSSGGQTFTIAWSATSAIHAPLTALRRTDILWRKSHPRWLILVTQSRMLISRPLVRAIDALLENNSNYATLTFRNRTGFLIVHADAQIGRNQARADEPKSGRMAGRRCRSARVLSRDHMRRC